VLSQAPHHEVRERGGIAPRILNLGTRWKWEVSFTPRPLYPRGRGPITHWIGGVGGGAQNLPVRGGEERKSLPGSGGNYISS